MSGRQPALTVDTARSQGPVASTSNVVAPSPRRVRRATTSRGADLPRSASLGSRSRLRSKNPVDDELLHPLRGAARQRLGIAPGASASSSSLTSTTTAGSGSGTDSAYGTLDEYDDSQGEEAYGICGAEASWIARQAPGWRDRVEQSFQTRARRRVQAVLDAEGWSRRAGAVARRHWDTLPGEDDTTAPSSPDLAGDDRPFSYSYGEHSAFASSESLASSPTSPSTPSSRSSPEPSEYGGDADSAALQISLTQKRHFLLGDSPPRALLLSRRHTLPRRRTSRKALPPSESGRRQNARLECDSTSTSRGPSNAVKLKHEAARAPLATIAGCLTAAVSSASALAPFAFVTPISPVHLRRAGSAAEAAVEITNAIFAPFLTEPTTIGVALAAANLYLLGSLERTSNLRSPMRKALAMAVLWIAIVSLRALLSHLLGRSVGWAFPRLLSTSAIHEPAAGFAPIVLACTVGQALAQRTLLSPFEIGILAANFWAPLQTGGAGFWMPLCGTIVGLVAGAACAIWRRGTSSARPGRSGTPEPKANPVWIASVVSLLFLPCLAHLFASPASLDANADVAFSHLHPASPTLLTVLLMTAPRPGNPDFLIHSIESWLGAFQDPFANDLYGSCPGNFSCAPGANITDTAMPTSSRIRMVVYTHFDQHEMYDLAQAHFEHDLRAQHYLDWRRDPRASRAKNRLDQRLHVARGLAYASSLDTAYVVLSEDDFPLCEDRHTGGWSRTWTRLQQALVRTNELMPDAITDEGAITPGHCGVFFATGGSGFAIRREIAARLPALLLGAEDADGDLREAAAARGEVVLKREGEDADTPDLVIQDCLRGKLVECADLCAPAVSFAPVGSARRPRGLLGDRYGKSGLAGTERLLQRHLGYNASTLPGRSYGSDEWACGWRQPFNGEPDVLTV